MTTWAEILQDKLSVAYDQFCDHVRKHKKQSTHGKFTPLQLGLKTLSSVPKLKCKIVNGQRIAEWLAEKSAGHVSFDDECFEMHYCVASICKMYSLTHRIKPRILFTEAEVLEFPRGTLACTTDSL